MRLIKLVFPTTVATVAFMAFIAASSASAETTTKLCQVHHELTCLSLWGTFNVEMDNVGVGTLLSDIVDILCLNTFAEAAIGGLGNPLSIYALRLEFKNCGTTSTHNNCTVTIEELPSFDLLKLGLDEGSLEGLSGEAQVVCTNIPIIGKINCKYSAAGLLFFGGAQHLTANETEVWEIGSKFFCPDNPTLDGLLETLQNTYILK